MSEIVRELFRSKEISSLQYSTVIVKNQSRWLNIRLVE